MGCYIAPILIAIRLKLQNHMKNIAKWRNYGRTEVRFPPTLPPPTRPSFLTAVTDKSTSAQRTVAEQRGEKGDRLVEMRIEVNATELRGREKSLECAISAYMRVDQSLPVGL